MASLVTEIIKTHVVGHIKTKIISYSIRNCDENIQTVDYSTYNLGNKHAVLNNTYESIRLRKDDRIATIYFYKSSRQGREEISIFCHQINNESFELEHLNKFERKDLHCIIKCYEFNITRSVNKSLIPYQHEVNLKDDKPVISKPIILPSGYG